MSSPAGTSTTSDAAVPAVGLREPCPCGSGRRYKACHGRGDDRRATRKEPVRRPFAGVPGECDWVALRELVPAATAPVRLRDGDQQVLVVTALPFGAPAYLRSDGVALVALQAAGGFGDPATDVAAALAAVRAATPETEGGIPVVPEVAADSTLTEIIDASVPFDVTVHEGFDYWMADGEDDVQLKAAVEKAGSAVVPTVRLESVEAAYWCEIGDRRHLRWVQPHDEDALLDAIARLHVAGHSRLGEGSRFVGSFRACGVLVPVWDLAADTTAAQIEEPAQRFAERLADALTVSKPLTTEERGARAGLQNRQITLR